jgi:tryptophanyl-tRNA synthetase
VSRILSGIQPTGSFHIGNYLGAVRNWVRMQEEFECFYCIVDLHALTVRRTREELQEGIRDLAIAVLASGVDPNQATLFVQSSVPEHAELGWILQCLTMFGELGRMTQFKDKSAQHADNINAGLFTYPALQAADIALYRATHVPVGEDQVQHLELTREILRRFRHYYGEVFPEPQVVAAEIPRVIGLDGEAKMSKSKGNEIGMLDEPDEIMQKLRGAVTDPQRLRLKDPGRPEVCNIFTLHGSFTSEEEREQIRQDCTSASIGCVDCKKKLCEGIVAVTDPIREKAAALRAAPAQVDDILEQGRISASEEAGKTMELVRERVGLWHR